MANTIPYGFYDLRDVFPEPVAKVGIPEINAAITRSLEEHNRQLNSLLGLLVQPTTDYQIRYNSPQVARLQPADEFGRPRKIKGAGYYTVAFPIQEAMIGFGQTYEAAIQMTVQQVANRFSTMLEADVRWMRDHILAGLFLASSWTYEDLEYGDLTIMPIANGDSQTYQIIAGADQGTTDNHLLAQANPISDTYDPFPALVDELREHPENGGNATDVVALIPTNLKTAVIGLTGFYPLADPNIRPGSGTSQLVGSIGVQVPGTMLGYHDAGVWISEWAGLPSNYLVAVPTMGDRPLAMRQPALAQLQGFRQTGTREDHPYYDTDFGRKAGFGALNRVGGAVLRVGNASYATPSNFGSPMP